MKLLLYFRFLRPLRSLLIIIGLIFFIEGVWAERTLQLEPSTAWFLALTIVLPVFLGVMIAGALHEPMHRPFALLLPNLRERQRGTAIISILIASVAVTGMASWFGPQVSPVATFGLVGAIMALPCLDRHQMLGGLISYGIAGCSWIWLGLLAGIKLPLAMQTAPAVFLLGGLTIGAASLRFGFSRQSLRARSPSLYIAYQTHVFSYLFRRGMVVRWQAELLARRARQKKGSSTVGPDWKALAVGTSSLDWMRVLWHANFGPRKRGSFVSNQMPFAVLTLIYAVVIILFTYVMGQKDYWTTLAQLPATNPKTFVTKASAGAAINFVFLQPFVALFCALQSIPQLVALPISRERLARVVFWCAAAQWAAALVVPFTTIFLASLLGQLMSGHLLPAYGLTALLAVDLPLAAMLPLLVAAGTLRRPSLRILTAAPLVLATMMITVTVPRWRNLALTPLGLIILLSTAAASQWLLWKRLHHQYANSDFPLETGFWESMGTATGNALTGRL